MKKLKSILRQIALFFLGIVFSACITVLAETINTKINSNKLQANIGEIEDVDAAISGLVTQTYNLDNRLTALENQLTKYYNSNTDSIELNTNHALATLGGYIDFHYNGSTSDYTSRISESASGVISIEASNGVRTNYSGFLAGPVAITPTADVIGGTIPENKSYTQGNATFLNFQYKFDGLHSVAQNTATVIAHIPAGSRPSAASQCQAQATDGSLSPHCWVRPNGEVVLQPGSYVLAANSHYRITGAYIH
jgi:hypothetical protein